MTDAAAPIAINPTSDPELRKLAVETDTALMDLAISRAKIEATRASAVKSLRSALGQRAHYVGRQRTPHWDISEVDTITQARERFAGEGFGYDQGQVESALASITVADRQLAEHDTVAERLEDVWRDNGQWSRYFLVLSNNGHVHYDISGWRCSRRLDTPHGWNPELSGLTQADAVAKLGPLLCTVCFPAAPVEWTLGKPAPARCTGSGKAPVEGSRFRRGMNNYGACPECDTAQIVTFKGIRAHKPAKADKS